MNILQTITLFNRVKKAKKKSKELINTNKGLAEKVRKHIDKILDEFDLLIQLLPDLKNVYFDLLDIIEDLK